MERDRERDHTTERKKRFAELATASRSQNAYYFTDFMPLSEAASVFEVVNDSEVMMFGGYDGAERVMLRFGDAKAFGYTQEFPIVLLRIAPRAAKFAEELTHRDFLGTLMGLGIERDVIGDILVKEASAFVFTVEHMTDYIMESVLTVRHTSVAVEKLTALPEDAMPQFAEEEIIVASIRLDGILAKLYRLSREKTKQMFAKEQVLIGGRPVLNPSFAPKPADVISVRGHGKFIFDGNLRETKKGNTVVKIRRYV